jgi:hypothetical protein
MARHFSGVDLSETVEDGHLVRTVYVLADEDCLDSEGAFSEAVGQAVLESAHGVAYAYIYTEPDVFDGQKLDEDGYATAESGFRKNTGSIGTIWRPDLDAFVGLQPAFPSWTLDSDTGQWVAPVLYVEDTGMDHWDEGLQTWGKPPEIHASWVWVNHTWEAPVPYPYDLSRDTETPYKWSEDTLSWIAEVVE